MTLLGVVSTGRRPGRGGSSYRYFNFEEMKEQDKELMQAGRVSGDEMWGRSLKLLLTAVMLYVKS